MACETSNVHLVNDRPGGGALQRCVAFPIVAVSIDHDALHRDGCVVAFEASCIATVIPGNDYTAPVRIKKNLGGIKTHAAGGIERTVDPISIKLPRAQAGHELMPIVVGAVGRGIDRNYARGPGIIFLIKKQQIDGGRPTRKHAEIYASRKDRCPQRRTVTCNTNGRCGNNAHNAALSTVADCGLNRFEFLVKSRSHLKARSESISSVLRQDQLPSARPGMFIRASLPRFSKSCSGAIASADTDDHARHINAGAASPFPL